MIGWALRFVVLWGALALVAYSFVIHIAPLPEKPAAPAVMQAPVVAPDAAARSRPNSLVFRANAQGHVIVDGAANGAPMRFMIDTGATLVALSRRDAEAAGLADLTFGRMMSTANGRALAAPVTLRELTIGQLTMQNVPAVVMDNLPISLLGQSFLNRLDSYEMRDGVLTLNWN